MNGVKRIATKVKEGVKGMAVDKNGKRLPPGISYRATEDRYMGRFMYHNKTYTVYGKTSREAKKNLDALKYDVIHGQYFKDDSVTFNAWFEIWIKDYKEPSVKAGTINVYYQNYNAYIKNCFGDRQLRDIWTDHIQRFYNMMAKDEYSHNTLEICRAILNGMYTQAIRNELLQRNPVSNAVLPKNNKRQTANVLTFEEQKLFLKYAADSKHYPLYELALSTGMRSGEIRGLQWADVDFKAKQIHVTHTLVYVNGQQYLDSPKTSSSERTIPMLNNVSALLKQQKKRQLEERIMMGQYWTPQPGLENLVFTNMEGHPINRDRFKRGIDKVVERIHEDGIAFPHTTPHTFRHTFATRCIEQGIPPKVLQTILGHNDLATTMDTYAHVMPDTKVSEMQKIAVLFEDTKAVSILSQNEIEE